MCSIPTLMPTGTRLAKPIRSDAETEAITMRVAIEHERAAGRQVRDVRERELGYGITWLDSNTGELRLIEVKGLAGDEGVNAKRKTHRRRPPRLLLAICCNPL
jgi:hypothetical protein